MQYIGTGTLNIRQKQIKGVVSYHDGFTLRFQIVKSATSIKMMKYFYGNGNLRLKEKL